MEYLEKKPDQELSPFIHCYWELKGGQTDNQWERNFPDGCAGLVLNLGETCLTDHGSLAMESGKTYVVGAMTSFKDSFIHRGTHLVGVCFQPATFGNFYAYANQYELIDTTIEMEKRHSLDIDKIRTHHHPYLNRYLSDRLRSKKKQLHPVLMDIHGSRGQLSISELAKRHASSVRQLERGFKAETGMSPKEYSNIIRFQNALNCIKNSKDRSFLDIAFECGYYDHAHLTHDLKRKAGLSPSQL